MVPILWIGFVETEDGKGLIFVGGHLYPLNGPIDIDQPFEIEIRNIDWSVLPDPTYDLYINDVLYAECVPFDRPVDGFERLDLLNITHGYVIFDDIVLIEGDVDHVCGSQLRQPIEPLAVPGLPHDFLIHHPWEENIPPDLPLPSVTALPSPTRTSTPQRTSSPTIEHCVFTALQNAHCRASDQVGSSELDILMQGEMAELIALNSTYTHGRFRLQNQVECWIRLGLLEGPENPFGTCGVPVIELPRVTPTSHVCDSNLDQAECEASGGMWNAGLSAEPYCVCPE